MRSLGVCVCVCVSRPLHYLMHEPILMKLGVHMMAPKPISMAYFIIPWHQSVCLCVSPIAATQRFAKNVTAARNIHTTLELFLDASFSM
jgi:hypothetical protein